MMRHVRLFQIDAFTDTLFGGNPAAVCPLERWLDDATLQAIAAENNLSETAFFAPEDAGYRIRWFTPRCEVELCGHATLAAAFVIFTAVDPRRADVRFASARGPFAVRRRGPRLALDFPAVPAAPCADPPPVLLAGLGAPPREILVTPAKFFAVYDSEHEVRSIRPDMTLLESLHPRGVAVTAPGTGVDFVSRYFAPSRGVPEDPVTGSIHCTLIPYWSARLGKAALHARQLSARGGELFCELRGDRVQLAGHAVQYMEGTITL